MSGAMVVANGHGAMVQHTRMDFTVEQEKLIRDMYGNGAGETEFRVFMEICKARRLNPLLRQIYFVSRNEWQGEGQPMKKSWTVQVGIDGFRAIAERTGQYDGQDEPEFIYADSEAKIPLCAKVKVWRKGIPRPFVGVAYYSEYVQRGKGNAPNKMWSTMPHNQLSKCAEALAFRKAFPEDLSGLYTPDEMAQADNAPMYDGDTGEIYEEPAPAPPRATRRASVAKSQDAAAAAAPSTGTVNADAALADDLITGILDAANVEHVRDSMQRSMPLPAELREKVLVEGVKRLVEMVDAGDVDKVAAEARVLVNGGHISSAAANSKIAPAIRIRKASAPAAA